MVSGNNNSLFRWRGLMKSKYLAESCCWKEATDNGQAKSWAFGGKVLTLNATHSPKSNPRWLSQILLITPRIPSAPRVQLHLHGT